MNVDRELQAALDVDPSPEFVARVRMRIASEPPPRRWGFGWMAVAAAAAAVVIAVVAVRSTGERKGSGQLLASRALPTIDVPMRDDDHDARLKPRAPAVTDDARRLRPSEPAATDGARRLQPSEPPFRTAADPEILVDAREAAAVRRLLAGVSAGRIDLKSVREPSPFVVDDAEPVDDIYIEPLSIEPLGASGGGARP